VILSVSTDKERLKLFQKIIKSDLTVRQIEGEAKKVRVQSHFRTIEKDLELQEKEDRLRKTLGTKVTITKEGPGGQINIKYYSLEELNSIVEKITREAKVD
jgi:ParB family chromosome partitioning protein